MSRQNPISSGGLAAGLHAGPDEIAHKDCIVGLAFGMASERRRGGVQG
ncbi:MAG TPA: hypothetical protein VG206_19125 [Terriglobia bacterium]|nr:hypothetical protein [Terriglobia bacterium]